MALTAAELEANLEALDRVIGRGELSVTFADRTVMYRSISELKKARDIIASDLARLAGRSRQSLGVATKGFSC